MNRSYYQISKAGSLSELTLQKGSLAEPSEKEIRVRVEAIGLNFADIFAIKGLYSATPKGAFIPGLEFAGTVEACGNSTSAFRPGDRVMGVTRFGAYTSHINVAENQLLPLPKDWSFAEGAAFPVQAATAAYALLELGQLKAGQSVLIHSGAGGVGLWANRIARAKGANTIGTVTHAKKLALLEKEGFSLGLLRKQNWAQQVRQQFPDGVDRVLESIGGKVFTQSYDLLASEGRIMVFGASSYQNKQNRPNWLKLAYQYLSRPKIDPLNMIPENRSVMAFNLIWLFDRVDKLQELIRETLTLPIGKPVIDREFSFEELPEALNYFQAGTNEGKVVVNI